MIILYTCGALSQYRGPTWKAAGGTVWKDLEGALRAAKQVYIGDEHVEAAAFRVFFTGQWEAVEETEHRRGRLPYPARVETKFPIRSI